MKPPPNAEFTGQLTPGKSSGSSDPARYVTTRYLPSKTMCGPPANHCEISMLANIRRIREGCQPAKCNRMESFSPASRLIPVCGITLGNCFEPVYNQADDFLYAAST